MTQYKILAVSSPENNRIVERLLESENTNRMVTLPARPENLARAAAMPVDAVVVYSEELTDAEQRFVEQLFMNRGKIAFILICREPTAETYGKAMGCGISRVLKSDLPSSEICSAIVSEIIKVQNRVESADVREFDSCLMTVFSTKGGTGKTTLAVNLAVALQRLGKKVAVVDLDLQFGDVGIFLNVPHCETISDLAAEQIVTPSLVNSFLYKHKSGISVLCAPESPELAELVKPELIDSVLTTLRVEYDFVICDLAPSLDDVSLLAVDRSDIVFFITNPEIPTLKNTHTCLSILNSLNYSEKVHLIINKDGDDYVKSSDVKAALNKNPDFIIPNDPKAATSAMNRGIPVVTSFPKSEITKAIYGFAASEAGISPKDLNRILRKQVKEV